MINFQEPTNSPILLDTRWIESLALDEINMEESGVVHLNEHLNPLHHLEQSSVDFMDSLKDRFEYYCDQFNKYRTSVEAQGSTIKLFKISNTVNDFMLYRNSLKLIINRKAHDLIQIYFMTNSGGIFAPRIHMESETANACHEIRAHIGPFHDVTWRFKNEEVNVNRVVQHYLTEFIRNSAR